MMTLKWVLALAVALVALSFLARTSSPKSCCERHRTSNLGRVAEVLYCPQSGPDSQRYLEPRRSRP
jgi:hypothetical protein